MWDIVLLISKALFVIHSNILLTLYDEINITKNMAKVRNVWISLPRLNFTDIFFTKNPINEDIIVGIIGTTNVINNDNK